MSNANRPERSSEAGYNKAQGGIAMKKIEIFLEELYKSYSHLV